MKMKKAALALTIALLSLSAGCQKPSAINNPMTVTTNPDDLWMTCKQELRDRGFVIDFQNRTMGIMETKPLISKQWFEFWKKDVVDNRSLFQSSTQTTSRVVTLNISDSQEQQTIKCSVAINKQYRKIAKGSAQTRTEDNFIVTSNILEKDQSGIETTWQPTGNDQALEQAILRSIQSKIKDHK